MRSTTRRLHYGIGREINQDAKSMRVKRIPSVRSVLFVIRIVVVSPRFVVSPFEETL